ncbi:hypothetical protein PUR61_04020 [Streptomyces sp. BE20]|uniref:hypothetical protein n=1 Tax=Streptomyces sp. BE20 TaxID=3002525 RepID=UPI002E77ECB5|nr:hypothetical protein [Streptomyces sp. BE20]MEE1821367.1 hypothetical protein [Streptomyces sp. BE20]
MVRRDERAEGAGPFTTRVTWRRAEGGLAVWESRPARKRGVFRTLAESGAEGAPHRADGRALHRLRTLNTVAAVAFVIGGALFALGALLAAVTDVGPTAIASVFFAGGLFFNTGGYASLLQAVNAPRRSGGTDAPVTRTWRWWSYEPQRIDWLSTFVLFAGTLVFGVNLLDSFLQDLSARQADRLVWAPDMVGCVLFLISGHLALVEVCHGHWCVHARGIGWWIVLVNQIGSVFFLLSAVAAFTRPETGSPVNTDLANWGTFAGALCFSAGGVVQYFERP